MTEIKQTLIVKNHKLLVNLPKEFNYKHVNVIITPFEPDHRFSFEQADFMPIDLKNTDINSVLILREERDLK